MKTWILGVVVGLMLGVMPAGVEAETASIKTTHEAWLTGTYSTGAVIAATFSDGDSVFGMTCWSSTRPCQWRLSIPDMRCEAGATYPALMSSPRGSSPLELRCGGEAKDPARWWYAFANEALLFEAIGDGTGTLRIALPMKSGEFKAITFSLAGSVAALEELKRMHRVQPVTPAPPTRPQPARRGSDTIL